MNRIEKQQVIMNESTRQIRERVMGDIRSGVVELYVPPCCPLPQKAVDITVLYMLTVFKIAYIAQWN